MVVIIDMILTVAEIPLAAAAVTELQIGVADIRSAADHTTVGIGFFDLSSCSLVRAGRRERNCSGLRLLLILLAE